MNENSTPKMTVVLAIDGSACAQIAIDLVRSMSWPAGTQIQLVTVLEPASFAYAPVIGAPEIGGAASELKAIAATLKATGAQIQTTVLSGRPATAIVEHAETVRADLVVVGSRGHGTVTSMILGSVSAEVADHAHCPVLVARQPRLTSVIVATDGSDYARTAEDLIAQWPSIEGLPIEVVSVADIRLPWTSSLALSADARTEDYVNNESELVSVHRRIASECATRLTKAGRSDEVRVLCGDPAAELVRLSAEEDQALVVVGTHGATGLRRLLAGSVARNVMLHAHGSVMVVREIRAHATAQTG